jgi:hypothetical protein
MGNEEAGNDKPKAPSWAVGLVFLITSGLSAATGTYFVLSSDIKQYLVSTLDRNLQLLFELEF